MKSPSTQEKKILVLISQGYSTNQMAFALSISSNTVETHRKRLLAKLDARNAADLVRRAMEARILGIDRTDKID